MRLAQISDFHFTRITWNPLHLLSKRILGNLNWLWTRGDQFSEEPLSPLPDLFRDLKVDLILFGGDFTTTSMHEEFEVAKQYLAKFSQPWIAVPGNHDVYTLGSERQKRYYRYFSNRQSPSFGFSLIQHGVEAHLLKPKLWVIALDTARARGPLSSQGSFPEPLETNLKELLQKIPPQDSILLFNHYPFFQNDEPKRTLTRGEALQKILESDPRIRVYLHGHTHRHILADLQKANLPLILDSGSTAQKKGSWNLLDLHDTGCKVTAYRYADQWLPERTEEISWTR